MGCINKLMWQMFGGAVKFGDGALVWQVFGGAVNSGDGALRVRTTAAASDTAVARLARLVEEVLPLPNSLIFWQTDTIRAQFCKMTIAPHCRDTPLRQLSQRMPTAGNLFLARQNRKKNSTQTC